MDDMISDDNFDLNLCVVPTICYVVVIPEVKYWKEVRRRFPVKEVRDNFLVKLDS